jgi:hypothetical protein
MRLYVNIYAAEQRYGGPEEGGWWFDTGAPVGSIPVQFTDNEFEVQREWFSLDHGDDPALWDHDLWGKHLEEALHRKAQATREEWAEHYPFTRKRYSVNGGGDYNVVIEDHFAQPYPEVRPHYE